MRAGFIKLHRKILENYSWQDKPFTRAQAFIDLLLAASYKRQKLLNGNEVIELEPGEVLTSIRCLCSRWGWSISKTLAYIKLLESDGTIVIKSDKKRTIIQILNWQQYQGSNTDEG